MSELPELDNLVELNSTFRKLTPRKELENALFTYQGVTYLAQVTGSNSPGEFEIEIQGFVKNGAPVKLPERLLEPGDTATVIVKYLEQITKPVAILNIHQYAGEQAMRFIKSSQPEEAERWSPHIKTEMPVLANVGPGPKTA